MKYVERLGSLLRIKFDSLRGKPPSFERVLADLVETHLVNRVRGSIPTELYAALGCHSIPHCFDEERIIGERPADGMWGAKCTEQGEGFQRGSPAQSDTPLVCKTLLLALRSHLANVTSYYGRSNDGFCILDGFAHADRWESALQCEDDAYVMAELLTFFAQDRSNYDAARRQIESRLCPILNNWLSPTVPFQVYPSLEMLARAMFGNAWYDIVGGEDCRASWDVADIIREQHPPFMPGLLLEDVEPADESLPVLET